MDIGLTLVIAHIIGTVLGVGGATMIEVHLNQALKDDLVSGDEKAILAWDYRVVRVGLIIAVLSGFGLLVYHRSIENYALLYNPIVWAKMLMVLIIVANTLLLQARKISLYWGSAFSFVSWWTVAIIGVFVTERAHINLFEGYGFLTSFSSVLIIYALSVVIGAIVLHIIRNKFTQKV